jgi:hypothetical protein
VDVDKNIVDVKSHMHERPILKSLVWRPVSLHGIRDKIVTGNVLSYVHEKGTF